MPRHAELVWTGYCCAAVFRATRSPRYGHGPVHRHDRSWELGPRCCGACCRRGLDASRRAARRRLRFIHYIWRSICGDGRYPSNEFTIFEIICWGQQWRGDGKWKVNMNGCCVALRVGVHLARAARLSQPASLSSQPARRSTWAGRLKLAKSSWLKAKN